MMSLESNTNTMHYARNVQKNWCLSSLATTFRLHLRPHPSDKPESWPTPMWQVLDQISALIPEYRGHVAFLEKIEKLWRDEERVRASGLTTQDLKDILVYFQGMVHVLEQHVEEGNSDIGEVIAIEDGTRNIKGSEGTRIDIPEGVVESKSPDMTSTGRNKITDLHRFHSPRAKLATRLSNRFSKPLQPQIRVLEVLWLEAKFSSSLRNRLRL
jgi:hypothetical protein